MKYEVDLTKTHLKKITIEVPENVSEDDLYDYVHEAAEELFDLESYMGPENWEGEDFFGTPTPLKVKCVYDEELAHEVEDFSKSTDNEYIRD